MFSAVRRARERAQAQGLEAPAQRVREAGERARERAEMAARMAALDRQRSTRWAIASLSSAGASVRALAVETALLELVNLRNGRAHRLEMSGFGAGTPSARLPRRRRRRTRDGERPENLDASVSPRTSYAKFSTYRPMTFHDFDGRRARFTSGNALIASVNYLMIFEGIQLFSPQIAYVRMSGWDINLPGGTVIMGKLRLEMTEGKRSGLVRLEPEFERAPREPVPREVSVRSGASERPRIDIPNEVLFAFDSAELQEEADERLRYLVGLINRRRSYPVDIEGHTDSVGEPDYNMALSRRRAEEVKRWFIEEGVNGAEDFRARGFGDTDPIAPNKNPDGSDNPEGRAKNRRVTLRAAWNL